MLAASHRRVAAQVVGERRLWRLRWAAGSPARLTRCRWLRRKYARRRREVSPLVPRRVVYVSNITMLALKDRGGPGQRRRITATAR